MIADAGRRLAGAPAAALPPASHWSALTPARTEFRRVTLHRRVPARMPEALVLLPPAPPCAPDVDGTGYWVFAPARLADGEHRDRQSRLRADRAAGPPADHASARSSRPAVDTRPAILRWPEAPAGSRRRRTPANALVYPRSSGHRARQGLEPAAHVAPFYDRSGIPGAARRLPSRHAPGQSRERPSAICRSPGSASPGDCGVGRISRCCVGAAAQGRGVIQRVDFLHRTRRSWFVCEVRGLDRSALFEGSTVGFVGARRSPAGPAFLRTPRGFRSSIAIAVCLDPRRASPALDFDRGEVLRRDADRARPRRRSLRAGSLAAARPETIAGFAGRPYAEVAVEVIRPFVGDEIAEADLAAMTNEAYATFRHPAVVPLDQSGANQFMLELFHGPTLAFKDLAMQLARAADGPCAGATRASAPPSSSRPRATPAAPRSKRSRPRRDNVDLVRAVSARPHLRRAAPDDDDARTPPTSTHCRSTAPSTIVRRW